VYTYSNYTFLFITIGGILLAAVYHTILFLQRKEQLLNYYSQYLWILLFYLGFRMDAFFDFTGLAVFNSRFEWDEMIQMLSFMFYIHFLCNAIFLKQSDYKYAWSFYTLNRPVVLIYCLLLLSLVNFPEIITVLKLLIRTYLLAFGLIFLLIIWHKKRSPYYNYLFSGGVSMIFFGLISTVVMVTGFRPFEIAPFVWLLFAFYFDVIFFSAALGYLIKQEYQQKEGSLKQLLKKEAELQQKELEKLKAVYETREEERMRIARDIHDDMGSTLSSIGIYSKVAASYVGTNNQKANEYLEKIRDNTEMLMESTVDLIWSLQTNYGENESIFKRMHSTAMQLLSSANIAAHFSIPPDSELPRLNIAAQKNCWLIFKEAINNVCKYSNAANCSVKITVTGDTFSLCIIDDGIGFAKASGNGNGLTNMRQRTEELDGNFTVQSNDTAGTMVAALFPLHKVLMHS
jgi:signal transduction histidine kinase